MCTVQSAKLPCSLCDDCDKKPINFHCGGDANYREINHVACDNVTINKDVGGIGMRFIRQVNEALLTKLCWRIFHKDSLWARGLQANYCKTNVMSTCF